jgi:hypothetical protein
MTHLKSYNESTGQLWRKVNKEDMTTRMNGSRTDLFTKGEVGKILDLVRGTGEDSWVCEQQVHIKTLSIELFGKSTRTNLLRTHYFGEEPITQLHYPRAAANNVIIRYPDTINRTPGWIEYWEIVIFKSVDDWFYVCVPDNPGDTIYGNPDNSLYLCDGIQGLLEMLTKKIRSL